MSSVISASIVDSRVVNESATALCRLYPFLHRTVIGESVCGKPIEALSIGHGDHAILFAAALRGQDHPTAAIALRFCEELCQLYSGEAAPSMFDFAAASASRTVVIVPMVNPDGVDIALHGSRAGSDHADLLHAHGADIKGYWQANANGIEPAFNFDVERQLLHRRERDHGIGGPCGRRFGGVSPESEPETAALCALCRRVPFSHAVPLFLCGNEIRWQYGEHTPPHARMTARLLASVSSMSAAKPQHPIAYGGFAEWFIKSFSRAAYAVYMGHHHRLPSQESDSLYEAVKNTLLLAAVL